MGCGGSKQEGKTPTAKIEKKKENLEINASKEGGPTPEQETVSKQPGDKLELKPEGEKFKPT